MLMEKLDFYVYYSTFASTVFYCPQMNLLEVAFKCIDTQKVNSEKFWSCLIILENLSIHFVTTEVFE